MPGPRMLEVSPGARGYWDVREHNAEKPRSIHVDRVRAVRAALADLRAAFQERGESGQLQIRDKDGRVVAERFIGAGAPTDWGE